MFGDLSRALGQLDDPRFLRVVLLSVAITIAALIAAASVILGVTGWFLPDEVALPWVGTLDLTAGWLTATGIIVLLVASVFLMLPVAFAVIGLFLDRVAEAVEARFYPDLPPVPRMKVAAALADGIRFLIVMILANLLAFVIYLTSTLLAPVIFWIVNGYLLGREYYQLVAARRLGHRDAAKLRRRNRMEIWVTGILLAIPLSIPLINLFVPVIGVATFCHQFHRHHGKA